MPNGWSEAYFIIAMMVLILVLCTIAVYFFMTQYKKEMRERAERVKQKAAGKKEAEKPGEVGEKV
jgi:F0F1-type ATP synthase membrane subunit b/b'